MRIPNETEGLNRRRHAMPQIKDFDSFLKDLEDSGIPIKTISVNPDKLKPTQGNFNEDKVKDIIQNATRTTNPILSSDDEYVLDGHHRWLAAAELGIDIRTRRVGLPIKELLKFVKDKPYVEAAGINESQSDQLTRLQGYYQRVARGEGGELFAGVLNRVNDLRQTVQDNPEAVKKKRTAIGRYIDMAIAAIETGQ